jgi:hypothetical protein
VVNQRDFDVLRAFADALEAEAKALEFKGRARLAAPPGIQVQQQAQQQGPRPEDDGEKDNG